MKSPISNTDNVELIKTIDIQSITGSWKKLFNIDVGPIFKSLDNIKLWKCLDSGFYWYSPFSAAGDGSLYAQLQKFDWYYMHDKWEFQEALSQIPSHSRILEVGSGFGFFLELAKIGGHRVSGIELNASAALRLREKGFEVFQDNLEDLSKKGVLNFDVICAFQVLEHISDPATFLRAAIEMLVPGGILVLSVPNAEVMRKMDPGFEEILNQPPHHMGHWDKKAFLSLEKFFPLQLDRAIAEPLQTYHENWILSNLGRSYLSMLPKNLRRLLINRYTIIRKHSKLGCRNLT